MSKYLKKFENHTQYESYTADTANFIKPNVSLCVNENEVHYNPSSPTPVETMVVAKFNVGDTDNPTQICYLTRCFSVMEIDGVVYQNVVSEYTFDTVGEHTVKYTLTDPTSIGNLAFSDCADLTSIDIPNSVTSIGDNAFYGCGSLKRLNSDVDGVFNIPNGVTSIGEYAFYNCYSFTSCNIGSGVTSIGDSAFYNNSSLDSVTIMATTPPSICSDYCNFGGDMSTPTIYVPLASVEAYKVASGWSNYDSYIEPTS